MPPKSTSGAERRAKNRTSKQQRYLKALGVVRPRTDFQLWSDAVKATLLRDIETGEPPAERRAAYEASLNSNGRCNLNTYRGHLWRPASEGGFGVVTEDERAHWRAKYQQVRAEWQERKAAALSEYPKRPDSPYFLFYRDFYARFVKEHSDAAVETVAKEAALVWKEKAKSDEFAHYHTESARLQKEYESKKAAFDAKMANLERENEQASALQVSADNGAEQVKNDDNGAESAPARKRIRTANWNALNTSGDSKTLPINDESA